MAAPVALVTLTACGAGDGPFCWILNTRLPGFTRIELLDEVCVTVKEKLAEACRPAESRTVSVKFDTPAVVGVPATEKTPAELCRRVSPAGSPPELTVKLGVCENGLCAAPVLVRIC